MKVLFVATSAYIPDDDRKTVTGYDYIVSEIAQKLSKKCDIDLYLLRPYRRNIKVKSVTVIGHTYMTLFRHFSLKDIKSYIKLFCKPSEGIKSRLRTASYYMVMRDLEQLINKTHYDIVHIHGVTYFCAVSSLAAARCRVPFLFTMHGLISYGIPNITQLDRNSEQAILDMVRDNDFTITTVSTGVKTVPCEDKAIDPNKIIVVNNAVKTGSPTNSVTWESKYPQMVGRKIVLSIGSITRGKNQIQLVRAYNMLGEEIKKKTMIFLVGQDLTKGEINDYIKEHNLENNVIVCGFLTKDELAGLYQIADYNALLSISEGFGLSMIEAAKYGIPTMTFSDLDAVKDIYSPNSMYLLDKRTDEAVAKGLMDMFSIEWDKTEIIKSADRFNEDIYIQYLDVYNRIIDNKSNLVNTDVVLNMIGL